MDSVCGCRHGGERARAEPALGTCSPHPRASPPGVHCRDPRVLPGLPVATVLSTQCRSSGGSLDSDLNTSHEGMFQSERNDLGGPRL